MVRMALALLNEGSLKTVCRNAIDNVPTSLQTVKAPYPVLAAASVLAA